MRRRYLVGTLVITLLLAISVLGYKQAMKNKPSKNISPPTQNTQNNNTQSQVGYRFPGEFEKQQAIWLQWPPESYNNPGYPVHPPVIEIIKTLAQYEPVNVAVRNDGEIARVLNLLKKSGYTGENVRFYAVEHLSIWARDVGPIYVKDSQNKLNIVNFGFNNYGRGGSQFYINTESQVHKRIGQLQGLPLIDTSLISEGGAIESNGKGTIMVTESVALVRNPGMSKEQIENEYKRVLGLSKVIWLKKGLAEDDAITRGHINEIARFADPSTILLAQVSNEDRYRSYFSQESYKRLEENYEILKNSTDQDGKPFNIIRIPMPTDLYNAVDFKGELPVRSYLNYALANGTVVMQTYWRPGRSEKLRVQEDTVKQTFRNIFKGRDIIGIDAENINLWGGGIHCITQHMPAE